MITVTGHIAQERYRTTMNAGAHEIIADEPAAVNGGDLGPTPEELLCSALVACTSITLRLYADRKGWKLDSVFVRVSFKENAERNGAFMLREIEVSGDLTKDQRDRLIDVANHCPIHRALTNPVTIETKFAESNLKGAPKN